MIKSRSAFNMPSNRPRRIWLNGVGAQSCSGKEAELRKSLPYCDAETGTKNRVVERDPIAGLGLLGKEYDPFLETRLAVQHAQNCQGQRLAQPHPGAGQPGPGGEPVQPVRGLQEQPEDRNPLEQPENGQLGGGPG
uniref:Uncharacterized protein n=1 Tax=Macrostomum lignano TaxID=282301 RepID=A0A1I8F813_9PLAT